MTNLNKGELIYLTVCVLLMPLNWICESIKWRHLVLPFEKITYSQSFKAIMSGISVALLTPNRIGEYGGRMVMVSAENNWKAVISTLISSYAQNIWNIGLGLIAAMLLLNTRGNLDSYLFGTSLTLSILFLILIIIFFFNINLVNRILKPWKEKKYVGKALKHLSILKQYEVKLLLKVLLWAFLRYSIYFVQYLLILKFFGLEVGLISGFIGIGTIFLVQTSLPLPPILGFLARGEIALLIWASSNLNELSVLAASYTLWILNLIIPSIVGLIIILTSNLWGTFGLASLYNRRK